MDLKKNEKKTQEEANATATRADGMTGTTEKQPEGQPEQPAGGTADNAKQLTDTLAKLEATQKELSALNDKYLRMIAEYDNFRRRSAKERDSVYTDAFADAVKSILPIGDDLERAAKFTDAESVAKGIGMVHKTFEEALRKLGITEIEAVGKTFDPALHNAVLHIEDEAYGTSEIVEVFQKGYIRGDRILRYAMVKVAN